MAFLKEMFGQLRLLAAGLFLVIWSFWVYGDRIEVMIKKSIGLVGVFLAAYALISALYWRKYRPSQDKSKDETQPIGQGEPGKKGACDNALLAEYEGAWKQIEYNMSTNWQFITMLLTLAIATNFIGAFFANYQETTERLLFHASLPVSFFWSSIAVFLALGIVYFFFFHRNATLAVLHSIRRLEIEAYLGMRANWREYLDRGELHSDIEKWARREVKVNGIRFKKEDKAEAERLINSNTRSESPNDLLPRIASRKRKEVRDQWQMKYEWMSAIRLVYVSGAIIVAWALWIIYLGSNILR